MTRAIQTGEIIATKIARPIEYSDLFTERRHPTSHSGLSKHDPEFIREEKEFKERFQDPTWRFEDGENFRDMKIRAGEALHFLTERSENNILIASHALFMRVLIARIIMGEDLSAGECEKFFRSLRIENSGLRTAGIPGN
jgi:broad specificity phosphatase PhoE